MHRRPTVLLVCVTFICCVTVKEKPATLTLSTVPPGATVEVKRGKDRFERIGTSPVEMEVASRQYDRTGPLVGLAIGVLSGLVAAGFGISAASSENEATTTGAGVSLVISALAFSFIDSKPPRGGPPEGLAEPIAVRFSKPGYREETFVVNGAARELTGPTPKIHHVLSDEIADDDVTAMDPRNPVIAVMGVQDKSEALDGHLLGQLQAYFTARLGYYGYRTVPTEQINAAIKELQRESFRPCYDEACQIEIGRALAAQRTVAPSILQIGELCVAAAGVYDLKTEAATDAATEETGCTPKALMEGFDRVARRLRPPEAIFEEIAEPEGPGLPPWAERRVGWPK